MDAPTSHRTNHRHALQSLSNLRRYIVTSCTSVLYLIPLPANNSQPQKDAPTYLTFHTTRLSNGTQLAAELDFTEHNVTYASIRMLARVHGSSGAVAGFFTYHNDTAESDIEIRTRDPPTQIHYSNQPTTDPDTDVLIADASFNSSLRDAGAWNVHRLDWTPGKTAWFINGAKKAESEVNVPSAESMVILSLWSNGGEFSGSMEEGGEAWMDVQWVELVYNSTGAGGGVNAGRAVVCTVEKGPGNPVESAAARWRRGSGWWVVVVVGVGMSLVW